MKRLSNLKSVLAAGALFSLVLVNGANAQSENKNVSVKEKNHIQNLVNGINSGNEGLKRSATYLAGKYKIKNVAADLKSALEKEENFNTKMLMLHSLYRIDEKKAAEAAVYIVNNDEDKRMREIAALLYLDFTNKSSERFVRSY